MDSVNAITTLLHLVALQTPPGQLYTIVVSLSTFASFVWHYTGAESGWLMDLDYALAVVWFLTDTMMSMHTEHFENILFWNCIIAVLHKVMTGWMHAVWHVLSALKCILVSRSLSGNI
jgi:hypothetical protein